MGHFRGEIIGREREGIGLCKWKGLISKLYLTNFKTTKENIMSTPHFVTDEHHHLMIKLLSKETGRTVESLVSECIDRAYSSICEEYETRSRISENASQTAQKLIEKLGSEK